ncbi:long-chain-fatty-acid--CoA ligase [Sporosarcina sp. UB5]|uniref:long-chain-fatty-acid--CoA ligase n=1 Tax=Sporosarcina sp. UB5 TaxID=3047463 RepID=UPI003D78F83C
MGLNLNELLTSSSTKFPNRKAVIVGDESITYKVLQNQVNQFSDMLVAKGIKKGDKVALVLGNCSEFVIAYFGVLRTGAVVVPINPIYTDSEVYYILENSQATMVITHQSLEERFSALNVKLRNLTSILYTENFESLLQETYPSHAPAAVNEQDLAVILYTSGTTGKPKGAMLTHRNMVSNAHSISELTATTEEDIMVTVLPIFHVFCMTVCMNVPLSAGAAMLIIPKFAPKEILDAVETEKATLFAGVPTMYSYLLQLPRESAYKFATIRLCLSGGASLPVEVLQNFEEKFNVKICEGFGLSETAPVTAFNPVDGVRKSGSVGVDIPGVTNKVVNPEGQEVPRGEVGELIVKGPNVMMGYLGMPEETAAALKDGWFYTGDLAKMDEEGYVFIIDRMKDMILSGGYNVYPREVEEVLYEHPEIVEAAVIGVPHTEFGESVKAFVVSSSPALTAESVIEHCQIKLAKYKVPREVEFLQELPKNTTGKILRRSLRETISTF